MKNLIAAVFGLGLILQGDYVAAQCVNSSRCGQLGYTKNLNDCIGLPTLICPFDGGKAFCMPISSTGEAMTCSQLKLKVSLFNQTIVLNNDINDCVDGNTPITIAEGVTVIGAVKSRVNIIDDNDNFISLRGKPQKLQNLNLLGFEGSVAEIDNVLTQSTCTIFSDSIINNSTFYTLNISGTTEINNVTIKEALSVGGFSKIISNKALKAKKILINSSQQISFHEDVFADSMELYNTPKVIIEGNLSVDILYKASLGASIKANKLFVSRGLNISDKPEGIDVPEIYLKGGKIQNQGFKKGTVLGIYSTGAKNINGKWQANKDCKISDQYTDEEPTEDFKDCFTRIGDYDGSNWPEFPAE